MAFPCFGYNADGQKAMRSRAGLLWFGSLLLSISIATFGFDYDSYQSMTFDEVYEKSDALVDEHRDEVGISIPTPTIKAAFVGRVLVMPYECSDGDLKKYMRMVGFEVDQFPPINYCMELASESGRKATFHVQDALVGYLFDEVSHGDFVSVWVIWAYTNGYEEKPYFLVNSYEEFSELGL